MILNRPFPAVVVVVVIGLLASEVTTFVLVADGLSRLLSGVGSVSFVYDYSFYSWYASTDYKRRGVQSLSPPHSMGLTAASMV